MDAVGNPLGTVGMAATSLYVADLDAAMAWYEEKLGLQPAMAGVDGHRYASYLLGGSFVVLEPIEAALESSGPGSESTTVNLLVDREPAAVRAELVGRGVRCGPLVDSPNFSSFLVSDVDGNRFYVTRPVTAEARAAVEDASAGDAGG